MYVIVVGGGRVGRNIIEQLQKQEINVSLIEQDRQLADELSTKYGNIIVYTGSATDPTILDDAGINVANFFIAVTGNDEANIFSSILAKTKNKNITTIVRVNNRNSRKIIDGLEDLKKYFDLIVSPEDLASEYILKYILAPSQYRIPMFGHDIEILKIKYGKDSPFSGKPITNIDIDGLIVAFKKDGQTVLLNEALHNNDTTLPEEGTIYVITRRNNIKKIESHVKASK